MGLSLAYLRDNMVNITGDQPSINGIKGFLKVPTVPYPEDRTYTNAMVVSFGKLSEYLPTGSPGMKVGTAVLNGLTGVTITHSLGTTAHRLLVTLSDTCTEMEASDIGTIWVVKGASQDTIYNTGAVGKSVDWFAV